MKPRVQNNNAVGTPFRAQRCQARPKNNNNFQGHLSLDDPFLAFPPPLPPPYARLSATLYGSTPTIIDAT